MARYACTSNITSAADVAKLKKFDSEGYKYNQKKSTQTRYVFDREKDQPKPAKKKAAVPKKKAKKAAEEEEEVEVWEEGEWAKAPAQKKQKR